MKDWEKPKVINTDKAPTDGIAISELKAEGKCPGDTVHRQVKYLDHIVESDHGKLRQLIRPVRGFKTLKTAYVLCPRPFVSIVPMTGSNFPLTLPTTMYTNLYT